jgi:hypothetical protein
MLGVEAMKTFGSPDKHYVSSEYHVRCLQIWRSLQNCQPTQYTTLPLRVIIVPSLGIKHSHVGNIY